MEFNPDKCQVVRVSRARRPIPSVYYLHGQVLEVVDHAKYLGSIFQLALSGTSTLTTFVRKPQGH